MSADVLTAEQIAIHREVLARRMGMGQVFAQTGRLAASTMAVGLPSALVLALGSSLGSLGMLRLFDVGGAMAQGTRDNVFSVLFAGAMFCSLYALLQFFKRETASRESWFPTLFALPLWLLGLGFYLMGGEFARQMPPAVVQPLVMSWTLLWSSIAGGWAAVAWIRSGYGALSSAPVPTSEAFAEAARRTVEMSAVHGGRIHAITIGMQLIVPGIFSALSLAFADMVGVLHPDKRAMRRSGDLTLGMRSRIFRIFTVLYLVQMAMYSALIAGIDGQAALAASLVDFTAISPAGYIAGDLLWSIFAWLSTLAMLVMYIEREAHVAANGALRRHERAVAAGAST
jgi:hypothetical protein